MSIRIAHLSDLHVDERGRLDDLEHVLNAFRADVSDRRVDLVLLSGDLFERRSTPRERNFLAVFLRHLAEIAPIWGCKGNHDIHEDLAIFNLLETKHPVWIEERSTAAPGSAPIWHLDDDRKVGLLAMSWIDKACYAAQLDSKIDSEQSRHGAIDAIRGLLACLRAEAKRLRSVGAVPVMATHVMLGGSVVSTGQILIGQGIELSPSDLLDVGAAYVGAGHVHATQTFCDGRVAYAGSPHRCNFGEKEAKGWRLVTLTDEGDFVSNEFVELPARRIVRLEADWSASPRLGQLIEEGINPSCIALHEGGEVNGALVRFRYRVRPQDLHLVDEDAIAAILGADGAAEVQVEAVLVQEVRARAPEIVEVRSTAEKLDAWLKAKSIDLNDDARERLHTKLALLEGGTHATP